MRRFDSQSLCASESSIRRRTFRRKHALLCFAAATAAPCLVHAQAVTDTWLTTGVGNWSVNANWADNTFPTAGATTVLRFDNILANSYTATNDLGNPFQLQGIVFNSTSSASATIANAALNTLEFTGSTPFVTQSNYGAFTVSAGFALNPTSGDFTINGSGLGSFTLSGTISETGGARQIVVNATPSVLNAQEIRLIPTAGNTHTGGLRLVSGNLALGQGAAAGTGAIVIEGGSVQHTAVIAVANNVTLTSDMRFIGSSGGTYSGVLSGAGGFILSGTTGAPSINFTGASTYTGATTVDFAPIFTVNTIPVNTNGGTLNVIGATGALNGTSELRIRGGGTINLGNSTTAGPAGGRVNDAADLVLNGGYLFLTSTSTATYSETMDVLSLEGGHSAITLTPGTTAMAQMTFASLARGADRGTLFVRGTSIGDAPASNKANLFFTATPPLAGGGTGAGFDGTPDVAIIPFVIADRAVGGAGGSAGIGSNGFVTYSAVNGIRVIGTGEYAASLAAVAGTTNNVRVAASENPSAPLSINSLLIQPATSTTAVVIGTTGDTNTISFPTGNAGFVYTTTGNLNINTPLNFNANEGKFFVNTGSMQLHNVVSGTNGITKMGAGSLVLNAANTYSGPTTINGGSISFASTAALGSSNQIIMGGLVAGAAVTLAAPGFQYSGVSAATLTQDIRVSSGRALLRSSGGALTLSGTISGPGTVHIASFGDIILTGNNTYTGQTRIFSGNLHISSDANLGSGGALDIGASATTGLILDGNWTTSRQVNISFGSQLNTQAFDATLNGPLTGASALTKIGSGKLTLSTANPYSGVLTISAGMLEVNGSIGPSASAVAVSANATLSGTGSIFRPVTLAGSATLSPGNSAGTLRMNALTLSTGANLLFDVGTSTDMADLGGGTITLPTGGYTLFLGDTTGLAPGNFTLFTYGTRVNTLNPGVQNVPAGLKGTMNFGVTSGVLTIGTLREYEWAPAGADSDGSGAWTQAPAGSGSNWEIGVTPTTYDTTDDNANIGQGGTAGVLTLGNSVSVRRIKFQSVSSGVYEIAQGTGDLSVIEGVEANNADGLISAGIIMTGGNTMTVGTGRTLDLNGTVSGTGMGLTKAGNGLLRLGGANTYTGGTTVNAGILRLNAAGAYPTGTTLTVNPGGTFDLNSFNASATTVTGTGLINLASTLTITGGTQTVAAEIDGAGNMSFATGVLTLTGNNADWSGGLNTTGTGLSVTSPSNLGTGPVSITNPTSSHTTTIALTNGTSATFTNPIALTVGGLQSQFTTGAALNTTVTLSGLISGTAGTDLVEALEFTGSAGDTNTFILTNPANSFTGNVRVDEGRLAITSNGALGAAGNALDIFSSSTTLGGLRFDANNIVLSRNVGLRLASVINPNGNAATISGVVSLTGSLNILGGGVLTLSGANTYTGATNVNAGTLRVTGTHSGGGAYTVASGATLGGTGVITPAINTSATINGNVAPGTSVGQLTLTTSGTGATVFAPAGSYDWEIEDATTGAGGNGVRWDHLALTSLNITATSGNQFVVRIFALPGTGGPQLDNFDPNMPFSWAIATASGAITGFDLDDFSIVTTNFENNNTNLGGFYMSVSGSDLMLNYVPEPGSATVALVGCAGLLRRRRRF